LAETSTWPSLGSSICRRDARGVHASHATMKVAAREELDPDTYFMLISDGLRDQGYVTDELMGNPDVNEWLRDVHRQLMCIADAFAVTTVLERRGYLGQCATKLAQPETPGTPDALVIENRHIDGSLRCPCHP
jgi:hypothetical protein